MFYLIMHYNTFCLQLCGVRHMVNDHSDRERGNLMLPLQVMLYAPSHREDSTYHSLCHIAAATT